MPAIYQGDKKIVDRYVGETLITRAYQGNKLIFDAYSELSGTLPLTVRSRASQILENYIIYGTASGAGVETENKANPDNVELITLNNKYGVKITSAGTWQVKAFDNVYVYVYARVYNSNNEWVDDSATIVGPTGIMYSRTITLNEGDTLCIFNPLANYTEQDAQNKIREDKIVAIKSDTTPSTYIPHGYKLPLKVTSNGTTTDYPIYIGDSKLGEEEYVDYEKQKVYKRTEQLIPRFMPQKKESEHLSIECSLDEITITVSGGTSSDETLYLDVTPFDIPISVGDGGTGVFVVFTQSLGNTGVYISLRNGAINLIDYGYLIQNTNLVKDSYTFRTQTKTCNRIYFTLSASATPTPQTISIKLCLTDDGQTPTQYIPYLQPTDPPVPLPDITLPQGIATIDTEEEFKYNTSIRGRINPVHYAYSINADTAEITYLADNKNFTPAAMGSTTFDYGSWGNAFFMPRPCMLKSNGAVDYYLDPNDYSKKLDGTASDIADPTYDGNVMLEFPKIWYKFEPTGDDGEGGTFHCSNVKLDNDYECWCNYDANNNEIDHFYVHAYNAVILDGKMRSLSGYALTQENGADTTTGPAEIAAARANNQNGIDEWYTYLISDHQLLTHLATLMCKHVNHQAKFGRGLDSGTAAAKRAYVTGTLNDKGLFWGDTSTGTQAVKIFGIENFYACVLKRTAGLIGTSTGYSYKLTHGTKDGSTATSFNTNGSGYKTIARTKPANGHVTTMHYEANGFWIPATTGANRYAVYHLTGNGYVLVGGHSNYGSGCGSWCVDLGSGASRSNSLVSSALSCKPKA